MPRESHLPWQGPQRAMTMKDAQRGSHGMAASIAPSASPLPGHVRQNNYWAPLTCKRHTMPHPAQPQHTNYWAPRTRKHHQQEHWPQRPTERSNPTQHAKGRTGDCPGPRKETTTRRNVTRANFGERNFSRGKSMHDDLLCDSPPPHRISGSLFGRAPPMYHLNFLMYIFQSSLKQASLCSLFATC